MMRGLLLILAIAQLHALAESGVMRREAILGGRGEIFAHAPGGESALPNKGPAAPAAPVAAAPVAAPGDAPVNAPVDTPVAKPKVVVKHFINHKDGKAVAITDSTKFDKEFTISFKVRFKNFQRNDQMLVSTDEHALFIQGLGLKYGSESGKIAAWIKTDSGFGINGRGVEGSDNTGRLLSQRLEPEKWYEVKLQKTKDSLFLTVDGKTVSSKVGAKFFTGTPEKEARFDLEAGSSKVVAGKLAGSGDQALRGKMGDLEVIEGAPEEVAEASAPGTAPTAPDAPTATTAPAVPTAPDAQTSEPIVAPDAPPAAAPTAPDAQASAPIAP